MTTVTHVAQAMQTVLTQIATRAAIATGFVQRATSLSGAAFVQSLVFTWLGRSEATLEEMAQTAAALGVAISPQGLAQRFDERAADCLEAVLTQAVECVIAAAPVAITLLQRFSGVYVLDSSSVNLPQALAARWPGGGGQPDAPSPATLKLSVRLELLTGTLRGPLLQAGRRHDRTSPLQTEALPAGSLRLADLGYFDLDQLTALASAASYFLTQPQMGTVVYTRDGQRTDVVSLVTLQAAPQFDLLILLGATHRLACRLVGVRVAPEVAERRRRHLHQDARERGQMVSQARLTLADWTLYVTNVPLERLSLHEVLVLARVRWQIELLFKLWKSHGQMDVSRSANPWRILCETYAKLVALLVQHWVLLTSCWAYPDRSLVKAAKTVRQHALVLALALDDRTRLEAALHRIARCLRLGCRIHKRRAAPATFQLLLGLTKQSS